MIPFILLIFDCLMLLFLQKMFYTSAKKRKHLDRTKITDLQTYRSQELEALIKKYDAPATPEINIESTSSGIKVFWCYNRIKTEVKSVGEINHHLKQ